jgi:hypothetical protein
MLAVTPASAPALAVPPGATRLTDHAASVHARRVTVNNGCTMQRRIYQLKITLLEVDPPVWRRLLVPGGYTLDRVSKVIQLAFGWRGYHLHSFDIGGEQFGEPDPLGELELRDELDVRLDAVAGKGSRFTYVYDFGDWWEHEVIVEDVLPADPDERYPVCVAGQRSGPPEDVGGPEGYRRALAALARPGGAVDEDDDELVSWLGDFHPEHFDPAAVTTLLRRLT